MTKAEQTISLYANDGWKKWFAQWRFFAAPYRFVEKKLPQKGTITELGCGEGLFSNYVALSSPSRKVIGIELDKQRVSIAQKGLKNTSFKVDNVLSATIPSSDSIVMFHLLHHLHGYKAQEQLIAKAVKSLKNKGRLVIVEIDKDNSPKYFLTWYWDHFMVPWFFEKRLYQSEIYFRTKHDWIALFNRQKLKYTVKKYDQGMPFSHIIYDCTKIS